MKKVRPYLNPVLVLMQVSLSQQKTMQNASFLLTYRSEVYCLCCIFTQIQFQITPSTYAPRSLPTVSITSSIHENSKLKPGEIMLCTEIVSEIRNNFCTTCSPLVLQKGELLTKIYLYLKTRKKESSEIYWPLHSSEKCFTVSKRNFTTLWRAL